MIKVTINDLKSQYHCWKNAKTFELYMKTNIPGENFGTAIDTETGITSRRVEKCIETWKKNTRGIYVNIDGEYGKILNIGFGDRMGFQQGSRGLEILTMGLDRKKNYVGKYFGVE